MHACYISRIKPAVGAKEREMDKKGITNYIIQFAGEYKAMYIKSIILALIGVFFSLAPYVLMGDMVKKLFSGEKNFYIYLVEGAIMAAFWILRVVFHTLSTNISHVATFKLISNVRIKSCR